MLIINNSNNSPFQYEDQEYTSVFVKGNSAYLFNQYNESFSFISPYALSNVLMNNNLSIISEGFENGNYINENIVINGKDLDFVVEKELYDTENNYYSTTNSIENEYVLDKIQLSFIIDNGQKTDKLYERLVGLENDDLKLIVPRLSEKNCIDIFNKIQENPILYDDKNKFILSQFIKEYKILDQISKSSFFPYSVEAAVKCEFNEPLAFAYKDSLNEVLTLKDNSAYLAYFLKNSTNLDVLKASLIDVSNLTKTVKDYPNLEKIAKNMQIENLTNGNKIKFKSKEGIVELPFNQVLALVKQNPVNAQNLIDKNEYVEQLAIKSSPSSAKILPDMTPDQQILFYNEHKHLSSLIKNPSVELQVHAVKQNPNHIALFKSPCEQAQMISVQQFPRNIALIENPCELAQNIAVKKDPETLNLITSPLESVKKTAVLELPSMIASIDNPSEELRDLSLRNGYSIFLIENPTSNEIEKAIFNSPELIDQFPKSIQNLTAAHNSNPDIVESLSFSSADEIKNAIIATKYYTGKEDMPVPPLFINEDIQKLSLEHSGGVTFSRFEHLCDEQMKEKAVALLPSNIKHIESPNQKLQMIAIEKDPSCISYIKSPDKIVEIRAGALSMIQKTEFDEKTKKQLGNNENLKNDNGLKL